MYNAQFLAVCLFIFQEVPFIKGDRFIYFKAFKNASELGFDLESPMITDFGTWGEPEFCPTGQVVTGFQLKMEPQSSIDDTALNGIMFYCGKLAGNQIKTRTPISSKVGQFGEWESIINCPTPLSYAVGFELRSQKYQGTESDDSAAINMKLYCSDGNVFEGYPESRNYRNARYTGPQMCAAGKGICGIQTEVEAYQFFGDDTSLNNVRVKCCNANNFYKKY